MAASRRTVPSWCFSVTAADVCDPVPAVLVNPTSDHIVPGGGLQLVLGQRLDVAVVDFLLPVRELLELLEHAVELLVDQVEAQVGDPLLERVPAAVLAEYELGLLNADVLRLHDFVRAAAP